MYNCKKLSCLYLGRRVEFLIFFNFAKSLVSAFGTSADSFIHIVYGSVEVIPFGLKFGIALGADKSFGHDYNVSQNQNYRYGNCNDVPCDVTSLSKPIYRAGRESEG